MRVCGERREREGTGGLVMPPEAQYIIMQSVGRTVASWSRQKVLAARVQEQDVCAFYDGANVRPFVIGCDAVLAAG